MTPSKSHLCRTFSERELHSKVQLAHRRIRREACDKSSGAAIHAIVWIIEVDVIEDVERLKTELPVESLGNREILEQGEV